MGGEKRGVFATRTPHRPCPIGLSLVKIDQITGDTLFVSGVDLVDGTPILDIKPYIPSYDTPACPAGDLAVKTHQCGSLVRVAPWLESPPNTLLDVEFTKDAEQQLTLFRCSNTENTLLSHIKHNDECAENCIHNFKVSQPDGDTLSRTQHRSHTEKSCHGFTESQYVLDSFHSTSEARTAITNVLRQDPRSVYRREKCSHEPYRFSIDNLNITCVFTEGKALVVEVQPKEKWTYSEV